MKNKKIKVILTCCILATSLMGCSKLPGFHKEKSDAKTEQTVEKNNDEEKETSKESDSSKSTDEGITKTYNYYSDSESGTEYNIPESIEIDGVVYKLDQNVNYETKGTRNVIEKTVTIDVESQDDIEDTYNYISKDGTSYTLEKEEVYVEEEKDVDVEVKDTKLYEEQYGRPSIDTTKKITYHNESTDEDEEVTGKLKNYYATSNIRWEDMVIDGTFESSGGNEYELSGTNNITVSMTAETPTWEGYEKDVLKSMGLSSDYFQITSAEWNGDQYTENGVIKRNAYFHAKVLVADYTAEYVGIGKTHGYSTKVFYRLDAGENTKPEDIKTIYQIQATAKYVPEQ